MATTTTTAATAAATPYLIWLTSGGSSGGSNSVVNNSDTAEDIISFPRLITHLDVNLRTFNDWVTALRFIDAESAASESSSFRLFAIVTELSEPAEVYARHRELSRVTEREKQRQQQAQQQQATATSNPKPKSVLDDDDVQWIAIIRRGTTEGQRLEQFFVSNSTARGAFSLVLDSLNYTAAELYRTAAETVTRLLEKYQLLERLRRMAGTRDVGVTLRQQEQGAAAAAPPGVPKSAWRISASATGELWAFRNPHDESQHLLARVLPPASPQQQQQQQHVDPNNSTTTSSSQEQFLSTAVFAQHMKMQMTLEREQLALLQQQQQQQEQKQGQQLELIDTQLLVTPVSVDHENRLVIHPHYEWNLGMIVSNINKNHSSNNTNSGLLPVCYFLHILRRAVRGMRLLHRFNFVMRTFGLMTIVLDYDNRVCLNTTFSVPRERANVCENQILSIFAAPEALLEKNFEAPSDVWNMALVLLTLLFGGSQSDAAKQAKLPCHEADANRVDAQRERYRNLLAQHASSTATAAAADDIVMPLFPSLLNVPCFAALPSLVQDLFLRRMLVADPARRITAEQLDDELQRFFLQQQSPSLAPLLQLEHRAAFFSRHALSVSSAEFRALCHELNKVQLKQQTNDWEFQIVSAESVVNPILCEMNKAARRRWNGVSLSTSTTTRLSKKALQLLDDKSSVAVATTAEVEPEETTEIGFFGASDSALVDHVLCYGLLPRSHPLHFSNNSSAPLQIQQQLPRERTVIGSARRGVYLSRFPIHAAEVSRVEAEEPLNDGDEFHLVMFTLSLSEPRVKSFGGHHSSQHQQHQQQQQHWNNFSESWYDPAVGKIDAVKSPVEFYLLGHAVSLALATHVIKVRVFRRQQALLYSGSSSFFPPVAAGGTATRAMPTMATTRQRFLITSHELGKGGFGKVYLAHELPSRRLLACKEIFGDEVETSRSEFLAMVSCREFRNVCQAVAFIPKDAVSGRALLFMQLCHCSIHDMIRDFGTSLSPLLCLEYLKESACGLEALELQGLVHGDVKPKNLLLAADGVVKVSDFGVTGAVGSEIRGFSRWFLAPELLLAIDARNKAMRTATASSSSSAAAAAAPSAQQSESEATGATGDESSEIVPYVHTASVSAGVITPAMMKPNTSSNMAEPAQSAAADSTATAIKSNSDSNTLKTRKVTFDSTTTSTTKSSNSSSRTHLSHTHKSDVFALGVSALSMFQGIAEAPDLRVPSHLFAEFNEKRADFLRAAMPQYLANAAPDLHRLLSRTLSQEPADRPSFNEIANFELSHESLSNLHKIEALVTSGASGGRNRRASGGTGSSARRTSTSSGSGGDAFGARVSSSSGGFDRLSSIPPGADGGDDEDNDDEDFDDAGVEPLVQYDLNRQSSFAAMNSARSSGSWCPLPSMLPVASSSSGEGGGAPAAAVSAAPAAAPQQQQPGDEDGEEKTEHIDMMDDDDF